MIQARCAHLALSVVALAAGCVPLPSKSAVRRGAIWAQPGSATTFAWSEREKTRREKRMDGKMSWYEDENTRVDRTWVSAVDPQTGESTQLAAVRVAVQPFYWDAAGGVLWVRDERDSLVGLSARGLVHREDGALFAWTTAPFAIERVRSQRRARAELGTARLFHIGTGAGIRLRSDHLRGTATVDGSRLRLTAVRDDDDALVVDQATVDWGGAQPVREPDLRWVSAPLNTEFAKRVGVKVLSDGKHVAEVLDTAEGKQLLVHDFVTGRSPLAVRLDDPEDRTPELYPLAGDRLLVAVRARRDERTCLHGVLVAAAPFAVRTIGADDPCIEEVVGDAGRRWLQLATGSAYVDAQAQLVELGLRLDKPLALGPTTLAFMRPDPQGRGVAVEQLDLAAAALTTLGHHDGRDDTLLTVTPEHLVFLKDAATLVTVAVGARPGDASVSSVPLPALVTDGPDGEPLASETAGVGERAPRTQLRFGGEFGVSTSGQGAVDQITSISHWSSDHTNVSVGLLLRGAGSTRRYADIGGVISMAWFPSPIRGGWFVGAEGGVAYTTERMDDVVLSSGIAPSVAARAGYRGRPFAVHVSVVMPSLVDRDRGALFLGGVSLGMFGR